MRKLHTLLIITAVLTAAFSAYSLAAMNQVYYVDYEWYSQYNQAFSKDYRDSIHDQWKVDEYPKDLKMGVISDKLGLLQEQSYCSFLESIVPKDELGDYVYLYCYIGRVNSTQYRVKFLDIAQRANVVEIMISLNSPEILENANMVAGDYYPLDVVRINRNSFPLRGSMKFIFKDQNGTVIYENSVEVK